MRSFFSHIISALIIFASLNSKAQKSADTLGAMINESFKVYNMQGQPTELKIPSGTYLIVFRYAWINTGKGIDTKDSIEALENSIDNILLVREIQKVKVVVLSYDRGKNFEGWKEEVKTHNFFKTHPRYTVEYVNTNGNDAVELRLKQLLSRLTIFSPEGQIVRFSINISKFDYNLRKDKVTIKAKLLTDNKGVKEPLNNANVHVTSGSKNETIATAKTNQYGDFEFVLPNSKQDYTMKVEPENKNTDNIFLTTPEGKEISKMEKTTGGFSYKLLKPDIIVLSEIPAEDITLKYNLFYFTKEKELTAIENIYYESNKSEIQDYSERVLNKIVKIMKDNPEVKLEITSHTDAMGDDNSNKALSEKRAKAVVDYLISNGVSADRLKSFGKGETQIRNRCKNGVNCSDTEHEYNRRTEFKFIRP